jgi:hypothetical protein
MVSLADDAPALQFETALPPGVNLECGDPPDGTDVHRVPTGRAAHLKRASLTRSARMTTFIVRRHRRTVFAALGRGSCIARNGRRSDTASVRSRRT